jgi:serine phosphatase RsbU (regulator of sigma subunit)
MKESINNDDLLKLSAERQAEIRRLTEEINKQREAIEAQKEMIETQRDVAIKQRDELTAQKKEITSSINYAKHIQSALLPAEEIFTQYFKDHFILYKPKDIVSGDFYWVTHKDNRTILAAADCTGHGVPGGFMSIMGIAFLNEIVDNLGIIQPNEILNVMRERIIHTLSQGGKKIEAQDGMDIAIITYESENNRLQYAGAFNPVMIIRDGVLHELKADRMPIGYLFHQDKPFTNNEITVHPKDSVYLFSDGYMDQYGWRNDTKFKLKNFKQLLLEIQHVPLKAQKMLLENNLANWQGDLDQIDDIMVIGVQL